MVLISYNRFWDGIRMICIIALISACVFVCFEEKAEEKQESIFLQHANEHGEFQPVMLVANDEIDLNQPELYIHVKYGGRI